jgi:hypothetical protein
MSKKRTQTRCLALDASVARAAGTLETRHPTGALCRDFLIAVRSVCHRLAWSEAIKAEWDKHQSAFAGQWLVSMMNLQKLRPVRNERFEELREAIEAHSKDENVVAVMLKDAHLIEAALATDFRLASLDDTVRGHFSRLTGKLDSLRRVIWVNPAIEEEQAVEWLENGARSERFRKLKPR